MFVIEALLGWVIVAGAAGLLAARFLGYL